MMAPFAKKLPLLAFLKLTRSYNLLIIVCTQYLAYLFLVQDPQSISGKLMNAEFLIICISTVCIAAAGYIINDYHDVKIDMINKPGRVVIGDFFSRRKALIFYFTLCFIGIILGFLVSFRIGIVNIFATGLLWAYSVKFKKTAFWGNLIIGLLTAVTLLIIYVWKPVLGGIPLLAYAWFAFIITLIREIIKDIEDIRGDKTHGCRTLPIIWGIAKTVRVVQLLILIKIISLAGTVFLTENLYLQLFAFIIIGELIYLSFHLSKTDTSSGFRSLGKFCKLVMLSGILVMFFF
ncbi:MAG: geranylgeranylglycerol-phosphate geranylgeranyltransferase [Candidatus Cyclobacteriaceae bacterium M2_1C_046]